MQDEEKNNIDDLIREASKSYYPVYDDKAWEKMEALLDKHLPEKDDRKRPLIFYLPLLFITGVVFFTILYSLNKKSNIAEDTIGSKLAGSPSQSLILNALPGDDNLKTKSPKIYKKIPTELLEGSDEGDSFKNLKKTSPNNRFATKGNSIKTSGSGALNEFGAYKDSLIKAQNAQMERNESATNNYKTLWPVSSTDSVKDQPVNARILAIKEGNALLIADAMLTKETTAVDVTKPLFHKLPAGKKGKKGFANNFAITLSAGPDFSFVNLKDPGQIRLHYGAGLSYTIANRVTLRSGFYMAKKTYSAEPGDYHPPYGYWTYNTNLQRVDADCKVYEIPLAASYNIKQSKNHNWLAGIGFSTFLMKSETYNYLYKNSQGQTIYRGWTLRNKNNHFFSVLTISGGYQYRINHHLSIIAEPYLKLPLHGIGFGKIKLNSSGLLFTASIQPFTKRK